MLEVLVMDGEKSHLISHEFLPTMLGDKSLHKLEKTVKRADSYYLAMKKGMELHKQLPQLGFCKLWVHAGEGLPSKVAIVRKTGMLITDYLTGLRNWPGFEKFSAVCVCDSVEGNSLLRRMENPMHNDFEPARLIEDMHVGKTALEQLKKWIRSAITEQLVPTAKTNAIDELADLLPVHDQKEQLPGELTERDFEGNSKYSINPIKPRKVKPSTPADEDDDDNIWPPGNGKRSRRRKKRSEDNSSLKITAVRILPAKEDGRSKTVYFTPLETGTGRLTISVAGDSYVEHMRIEHVNPGNSAGNGLDIAVTKDKRVRLVVLLSEPIDDSLTASLTKKESKDKSE